MGGAIGMNQSLPLLLSKARTRAKVLLASACSRFGLARLERRRRRWVAPAFPRSEPRMVVDYIRGDIHPYAGLGHQVAGWISAYLWAEDLGLKLVGTPISSDHDELLDLSWMERIPEGLNPRTVTLFSVGDERNPGALEVLRDQVRFHQLRNPRRSLLLSLALDQPRWDQTPAAPVVRRMLHGGRRGGDIRAQVEGDYIAVHMRRGDVGIGSDGGASGVSRWVDPLWYVDVITKLREYPEFRELPVRVYSLGSVSDFADLASLGVDLRLNQNRDDDLVELTQAKVLVVAPSSFSFTAALATSGVVVARSPWWHHVPDNGRWIAISDAGDLSKRKLDRAMTAVSREDL